MNLPSWWPSDKPWIIQDCLEGMKSIPTGGVDLVLTDPPYGINIGDSSRLCKERGFDAEWDKARVDLSQLFRVGKNQIIWGGNYYSLPPTRCFLIWNKENAGRDFADCEMAWTSFDKVARLFSYRPINMDGGKLHPTMKPVDLFVWILESFTNPGDIVLDPFLGSGTTLLACRKTGRIGLGFEINPEYESIIRERSMADVPELKGIFDWRNEPEPEVVSK